MEGQDGNRRAEPKPLGSLCDRRQHYGWIGHGAILMEMMLGDPESVVTQSVGELRLDQYLLVQLRNGARMGRVMVLHGEDRHLHGRPAPCPARARLRANWAGGDLRCCP